MAGIIFPMTIAAQQDKTLCDFENADSYASVGVYDTWEQSPFRTGKLKGNCQVVSNFLNQEDGQLGFAPNESSKILGVQRSRYGSNTFGALVELKEPFALTKKTQYVHVMMYSPKDGNVMLIGLGNRDDRPWQSKKTEQFWSTPSSKVQAGKWVDVVFPISGANGITIHNLLVVLDRNSPHNLMEDFAVYVDNIVLSAKRDPFFSTKVYPINYEENTKHTRGTDRYLSTIGLTSSNGAQTVDVNQSAVGTLYVNKMDNCLLAKPGDEITPSFTWKGSWMCGYVYLDKGNDGAFNVSYDDSGITDMGDLMAYSFYKNYNSAGNYVSGEPQVTPPAFDLPADLNPGFYRMRYKVDWDCVDPGGNTSSSNMITNNGGAIVDVRINVHADNVNLFRATEANGGGLNGDILLANGNAVTGQTTPFNKAFTIKASPAPGFEFDYVKIRHGYNLEGPATVCENIQWEEVTVKASQFTNGEYTVPAKLVDGDIRFVPYFKSTTAVTTAKADEALTLETVKGKLLAKAAAPQELSVVDAAGQTVFHGTVDGSRIIPLHKGVYVANGNKVMVP